MIITNTNVFCVNQDFSIRIEWLGLVRYETRYIAKKLMMNPGMSAGISLFKYGQIAAMDAPDMIPARAPYLLMFFE